MRRVQKDVKRDLRRGQDDYRRTLEQRLQGNNVREVWRGFENYLRTQQSRREWT